MLHDNKQHALLPPVSPTCLTSSSTRATPLTTCVLPFFLLLPHVLTLFSACTPCGSPPCTCCSRTSSADARSRRRLRPHARCPASTRQWRSTPQASCATPPSGAYDTYADMPNLPPTPRTRMPSSPPGHNHRSLLAALCCLCAAEDPLLATHLATHAARHMHPLLRLPIEHASSPAGRWSFPACASRCTCPLPAAAHLPLGARHAPCCARCSPYRR